MFFPNYKPMNFIKSFYYLIPCVGSLLLMMWLITKNVFFAYLSISSGIIIFTTGILFLTKLSWYPGTVVLLDVEVDFLKLLSSLIFILMILLIFLYKVL